MTKRLTMLMGGLVLSTGMALAQTAVTGKVTSADDGSPVVGASIKVVGTNTGTVTDIDGNFTVQVQSGSKLSISFIVSQTYLVTSSTTSSVKSAVI